MKISENAFYVMLYTTDLWYSAQRLCVQTTPDKNWLYLKYFDCQQHIHCNSFILYCICGPDQTGIESLIILIISGLK